MSLPLKRQSRRAALPEPDSSPPTDEAGLHELFGEIRATVGQEAQIVQAVFPNPPFVMQVFLQRVFAQVVRRHLPLSTCPAPHVSVDPAIHGAVAESRE